MYCLVILEHITLPQLRIIIHTCYPISMALVCNIFFPSFFIKIHCKDEINDNQIMRDHLNSRFQLTLIARFLQVRGNLNWLHFNS